MSSIGSRNKRSPTLVYGLGHGDADPQTVGGLEAVEGGQVLTVRQLQPLQDDGVGAGDDVFGLAQVVLQDLALVLTQVPGFVGPGAAVACREGKVAEGRDGELGAPVGQMVGRPDHGEGRWERIRKAIYEAHKAVWHQIHLHVQHLH